MSKIKNGGLDQYGAGPFEQEQFGTADGEGVNDSLLQILPRMSATKRICNCWQKHAIFIYSYNFIPKLGLPWQTGKLTKKGMSIVEPNSTNIRLVTK